VSERDRIVEQLLEVSKTIESRLEQQWKRGIVSEAEVLRARYARETVEVDLLKLRQAGAGPTTRPR
jgi:outer membrane protein TolC